MAAKKAVIWDMDGVIVDSAQYHYKSWHHVFKKRGIELTMEHFRRLFGQRNDTIISKTLGTEVSKHEIEEIADEKESYYRQLVVRNVKALPGAIELIKQLAEAGFSQSIASSAPMENIKLILDSLGIGRYFKAIVYGREVSEGKPSPQCFLLAAQRLGVETGNCIVIEDAVAGVKAAKNAGIKCLAVTNTHSGDKLSGADRIVGSLEIDVAYLKNMLNQAKE